MSALLLDGGFLHTLAEPFMLRALGVALLVGAVSAVLSCFLVLRGWALMGDAIAHSVLPGLAIASLTGLPLALGAFAAGLACAGLAGAASASGRLKPDTALGVVFSGLFAAGLVIASIWPSGIDLFHVLFGDLLGVTDRDLLEAAVIGSGVVGIVLVRRRDLALWCFDEAHARAVGLSVGRLRLMFLALVALSVVATLKAVGLVMSVALLIGPGATASLLTRRIDAMLGVAVGSAMLAGVAGTVLSAAIDGATGPCVVLAQAALFALALLRVARAQAASRSRALAGETGGEEATDGAGAMGGAASVGKASASASTMPSTSSAS